MVTDDLGMDVEIIENMNLIVKLGNQCVLTDTFFGC